MHAVTWIMTPAPSSETGRVQSKNSADVPAVTAAVAVQLQRLIYVDNPDLGYVKGNQEIPAGADFELEVEVLSVVGATAVAAGSSGASSG